MIFLGYDFYSDESGLDYVPAPIDSINEIEIAHIVADELYVSNNTIYDMNSIPQNWDFDTVLHALFNGNLAAGNLEYIVSELTALRLKRREVGTYDWLTLAEFPINSVEDAAITYIDRYVEAGKNVEYMIVGVTNNVEGSFSIGSVNSEFDGVVVAEKDIAYRAFFYDYVPTERNHTTSVITTLNGRYPYVIKNAETNYTSGNIHGAFLPMIGCEVNIDNIEGTRHREEFTDFLTNGKPKVIKLDDGRSFIVNIVDNVRHSADMPILYTDFSFVETGDVNNTADLYYADLIDVDL